MRRIAMIWDTTGQVRPVGDHEIAAFEVELLDILKQFPSPDEEFPLYICQGIVVDAVRALYAEGKLNVDRVTFTYTEKNGEPNTIFFDENGRCHGWPFVLNVGLSLITRIARRPRK